MAIITRIIIITNSPIMIKLSILYLHIHIKSIAYIKIIVNNKIVINEQLYLIQICSNIKSLFLSTFNLNNYSDLNC